MSMPALAQEAGWFSLFLVQAVVATWTGIHGISPNYMGIMGQSREFPIDAFMGQNLGIYHMTGEFIE